jgi:hypothetical protein
MEEQATCGKGLAAHAAVPAKAAEWIAALAENLEVHIMALDLTDERSERERVAYLSLATSYRRIAADLDATAEQMAGYRDLPMGRHDPQAMASPRLREAFAGLARVERELLELLQK